MFPPVLYLLTTNIGFDRLLTPYEIATTTICLFGDQIQNRLCVWEQLKTWQLKFIATILKIV